MTEWIDIAKLELNEGQVPGLPRNPRTWTKSEIDNLRKSLQELPELFEARPVLAYEYRGRLIVIGGNMRTEASRQNGMQKVPVYVYPEATPMEKVKEIAIKDNGAFGAWDWDALANEWDNGKLSEWGVPVWKTEEMSDIEEKEPKMKDVADEIHECPKCGFRFT